MDLLKKFTIKNLKLNKKRTIVTIIGIILSVALITAVASMYASGIVSLIDYETYEKGNFHVAYYDVPVEEINTFENNRGIKNIKITQDIGFAKLKDSQNEYKPYTCIKGFTKTSLEELSVKLVEGRMPENENEIIIPTHLKTNGRINLQVGETITLEVGTRISEGNELTQQTEVNHDIPEEITNTTTKQYKIVGIMERPATNIEPYSAPGYTFITYLNPQNITGKVDIYASYTKQGLKEENKVTAGLLGIDEKTWELYNSGDVTEENNDKVIEEINKAKYEININGYLISLETNPIDNDTVGDLGIVIGIVCAIIIVTSVFCIKNSFDISITEKTKQYGILKSIGATKKQIKRNVLFEATILGTIGIPIGIICGFLASFILVKISNYLLFDTVGENLRLKFVFSWIAVIFASLLGILTIYLSAIRGARRAAKISPIESIRNSGEIKIKRSLISRVFRRNEDKSESRKLKEPKIIGKIFGIGGVISYKNLKRSKKKYRTTVISIVVSVFTFIALSSFMSMAFMDVKDMVQLQEYNISAQIDIDNKQKIFDKALEITRLENIEEYSLLRFDFVNLINSKYSEEYKQITKEQDIEEETINIFAVGKEQYQKYVKKLGLNYDEIKDKAILMDKVKLYSFDENTKKQENHIVRQFLYKKGDKINAKDCNENEFNMEIGCITDEKPFGFDNAAMPMIIVSDETYNKLFEVGNTLHINIKTSNSDKLQDDIEQVLKDYDFRISNMDENVKTVKNLYLLLAIFLYGFIIVISLIGITNVFNTITTNMELRKPEFAMLKSIGMTTNEFNRMVRLESIFMGLKALLFGVPLGLILSYTIYHFLLESSGLKYPIPIQAILISIVVVFLLITCIMKFSISKINKQNTIETIRNENI